MPKKVVTKEISNTKNISTKNPAKIPSLMEKKKNSAPIKKSPIRQSLAVEEKTPPISNSNNILVENFVALQKVMTNLAMKFDDLSGQISRLLELFEISAKSIAGKDFDIGNMEKKLDQVLEQNKVIAKGVSLIHEPEESKSENHSENPRFKEWPKG